MAREKLKKLTEEQERDCAMWREKYFKIGWSTEPADRERAERGIVELYARLKKEPPKFVWFDSPAAACDTILESTGKHFNLSGVNGQTDAYWIAFYTFGQRIVPDVYSEDDTRHLDTWKDIVESTGPCFPFENYCLMSERPVRAECDTEGLLHCDDGPALLYKDGYAIYAINGVSISDPRIVECPWELTLEDIMRVENEDVRSIMQERWCHEDIDSAGDRIGSGGGRWLEETGAKVIHQDVYRAYGDISLMRALLEDRNGHKYLCCTDSSTDRVYYIRSGDDVTTCEEAHMSFNGGIPDADIVMSS